MAASVRLVSFSKGFSTVSDSVLMGKPLQCTKRMALSQGSKRFFTGKVMQSKMMKKSFKPLAIASAVVLGGSALTLGLNWNRFQVMAETIAAPTIKPTRRVKYEADNTGLKLTLFQFQTCPFCCKTRAFLDYYGISYDVIEVNAVSKKELKWTEYKKVPVVVVGQGANEGFIALNESSVITSLLQSYLINPEEKFEKLKQLNTYYPCIESKEGRKTLYEFPNRYFIMFGEEEPVKKPEALKMERKWRFWSDDCLVHMLSPNVYRTWSESLETFNHFSTVGEWDKIFASTERKIIIYVGALAMYFVGKKLKKKHRLKEDVRQSLYDACSEWTRGMGRKKLFMGGDNPDLSDIAVYGILSSIEGCTAFKDVLDNTKIGPWFYRMKDAVQNNHGAALRNVK